MALPIPDLEDLLARSHVLSIPLVRSFRGLTHREVMIIEGSEGPGEWAAFTEYSDEVAALWLRSALEQAFDSKAPKPSTTIDRVAVNATFPALNPGAVADWWGHFPGVRSAKVKVGEHPGDLTADVERVRAIREVVGPKVTLRLDANARWSVDQAQEALLALLHFDIDYVEQPVASIEEMLELKRWLSGTGIRLAADELIRQSHLLDEVISREAADIVVLKVSPLGGIRPTLELARRAQDAGLDVVISSGLETSIGLSWGAQAAVILADEFGGLPDAGLGTAVFFETDIVKDPLRVTDGSIPVTNPVLDHRAIEAVRASPKRTAWWQERLRRCMPRAMSLLTD